jgi:hypothetical protein
MLAAMLVGGCSMEPRGLEEIRQTAGFDAGAPAAAMIVPPPVDSPTFTAPVPDSPPPPDAAPLPPLVWDAGPDLSPPDAAPALDAGLILYLPFDDAPGAAMAHDDSGLNQQALLHQVDAARSWVAGRIGGALALNGGSSGGWVSIEDAPSLNRAGGELSLAAWIYPGETGAGPVAARAASAPAGFLYLVEVASDGHVHVAINGNAPGAGATLDGPILPKQKWTHLAVTCGRGQVRIFVNGVAQLAQQYRAVIPGDSTPLLLGIADPRAKKNRFSGRLDELVLYQRVLGDGEIGALAHGARPAAGP